MDELSTSTRGRLLVATPALLDPNFNRAVIFMLEHNDDGAVGVVLNRPSELPVATTIEPWADRTVPPGVIFIGGPVSPSSVIALASVTLDDAGANWNPIVGRIGTVDLDVDPADVPGLDEVRMYAGYAGWTGGQLEAELMDDGWFVLDAELTDIHTDDPFELWWEVLSRQEGAVGRLGNYPRHERDN
jgi:putative transcriptional regulator